MAKKVILDVDTGIDDAMALSYAVRSPELEVIGITTCFGNTSVEEATRNTFQVLDYLEAEIPVAAGADKPLFRDHLKGKATRVHGENGIGDTAHPFPKREPIGQHAADFIVSKVKENPKQVTLILVGSLTNMATAIMKDPEIIHLVKEVIIMGGAVTVPGNVTPAAEANIYTDPEAAEYVFRSGLPITLVGLDVTLKTLLPRKYLEIWRAKNTRLSNYMADITEHYMNAYLQFYTDIQGCGLHDPLAVAVAIDRTFVKTKPVHVQVDIEGTISLGRTVGDLRPKPAQPPNMEVCLEVDADRFLQHFASRVV